MDGSITNFPYRCIVLALYLIPFILTLLLMNVLILIDPFSGSSHMKKWRYEIYLFSLVPLFNCGVPLLLMFCLINKLAERLAR